MKWSQNQRKLAVLGSFGIQIFFFFNRRLASETFSKYRDEMKIIPVLDNQVPNVFFWLNPVDREQGEHEVEHECEGERLQYQLWACDI